MSQNGKGSHYEPYDENDMEKQTALRCREIQLAKAKTKADIVVKCSAAKLPGIV